MSRGGDKASHPALARLLALLAYPLLIGIALWLGQPELRALGLPLLAVAAVGPWPEHRPGRLVLLTSLLLAAVVIIMPSLALWPPGLICLGTATWFAQSLRSGQQPLIRRFATIVHEQQGRPMPTDSDPWLRAWTFLWAALLAVLGAVALLLAIREQTSLWLAWVSLGIPGLVFLTLLSEYLLRRLRFPEHEHWSLGRFLLLLARIRPEHLAR